MKPETMKQIERHVRQEALVGNFAPMEDHAGMQCVLAKRRYFYERTTDRAVTFPLQFTGGEWLASIQRISETPTQPIFGLDPLGKRVTYEVLTFNRFESDKIVQLHSHPDFMGIIAQSGAKMPGMPPGEPVEHKYVQTGSASLSPDEACALVRHLIEESVRGNYAALQDHPTFKTMIPVIEMRRAGAHNVELSFPVQFSDGEWVASRTYWKQTVKGEMFGVDADGKQLEFEVLTAHRIEAGKVVAAREFPDIPAMMQQLGVYPPGLPE